MTRTAVVIGFGALAAFTVGAEAASISSGPYVGVVGGYQSTDLDWSGSLGGSSASIDSLALVGPRVGVVGGWGMWGGNDIYGAVELNAATSTADGSVRVNGSGLKLESEETYGASVLFGRRIVPGALLYGRVGWQRLHSTARLGGDSDDQWFGGIRAGAGGMWALSDMVTFRIEYTHSFYRSEKWKDLAGTTLKVKPRENVFQGGFTVTF
ncbi:MAG: outer membrane beta-barrel protein [Nitrococcus mobilis]|nr:outer membrane beta-barrel protein [Nitrococcus mobilis]